MRNSLSESTQGPPEALALAVAHLQANQLTATIGVAPRGNPRIQRHDDSP